MGGKKKKSMANKLAKMSDEERARYLQHRAEVEEEAKRRKEQLIATFMKKKIKKEEAFARLNMAKINQNWHHILRKVKCHEMKVDVEHMQNWIERVMHYKNLTISKLLDELQDAEEQYLNNFQAHYCHIDNMIENQNKYIETLQKQYDEDILDVIEEADDERLRIILNAKANEEHLKTVIFGQAMEAKKSLRESYERRMQQLYEVEHNNNVKLNLLKKTRSAIISALWKQLSTVVRSYVEQTNTRRMHLAELRGRDAEAAKEVAANEERIKEEEELIESLKEEHTHFLSTRENQIQSLQSELKDLNKKVIEVRKKLQSELKTDEKKLRFLVSITKQVEEQLKNILTRGHHILVLSNACTKLETEQEALTKWLPRVRSDSKGSDTLSEETKELVEQTEKSILTDDQKQRILQQIDKKRLDLSAAGPICSKYEEHFSSHLGSEKQKRAKTAVATRLEKSTRSATTDSSQDSIPEHSKITAVEVLFHCVRDEETEDIPQPTLEKLPFLLPLLPEAEKSITERCYESLKCLENFWATYNKVEIDYVEMKQEKKILMKENKQLRGMIRAVLEAAALAKTIPDSKVSTRIPSKRSAGSAPLRRLIFS